MQAFKGGLMAGLALTWTLMAVPLAAETVAIRAGAVITDAAAEPTGAAKIGRAHV